MLKYSFVALLLTTAPTVAQECIPSVPIITQAINNSGQNKVAINITDKDAVQGTDQYLKDNFFFTNEELKDTNGYVLVPGKKALLLFGIKGEKCLDFVLPMNYKDVEGVVDAMMSYKGSKNI